MKKFIFLGILISVLVLAGCGASDVGDQTSDVGDQISEDGDEAVDAEQGDETAGWQTYRNEEYGYEVIIPSTWKDYTVEEGDMVGYDDVKNFNFRLPLKGGGFGEAFAISIYSSESWDKEISSEQPHPTLIEESGGFVAAYALKQEPLDYRDLSDDEVVNDAREIISTFKFVE